MITLCSLAVLSALLKSKKAAIVIMFLVATVGLVAANTGFVMGLVVSAVWFLALMRFGLIAMFFTAFTFALSPSVIMLSKAWSASYGYFILVLFAAIVLYAFRYSLGGRPLLASSRLDD
jgi:Gpi18-like mannosyltransferase